MGDGRVMKGRRRTEDRQFVQENQRDDQIGSAIVRHQPRQVLTRELRHLCRGASRPHSREEASTERHAISRGAERKGEEDGLGHEVPRGHDGCG
jgi:hypothetical protein